MENYILYQLGDFYTAGDDDDIFNVSFQEITAFKDKNGISNMERLYTQYSYKKQAEYKEDYERVMKQINAGQTPGAFGHRFIIGTMIAIPPKWLNLEIAARDGGTKQVIGNNAQDRESDSNAYYGDQLKILLETPSYTAPLVYKSDGGNVTKLLPGARVFIWCRSLKIGYKEIDGTNLEGRWIEATPFVRSVNTTTTDSGGSFIVDLAPVAAKYNEGKGAWETDADTLSLLEGGNAIVGQTDIYKKNNLSGTGTRTPLFFELAIQENDLVFISFERDIYKNYEYSGLYEDTYNADPETVLAQDMMGLVDKVNKVLDTQSNDISIKVEGRDFSKLLIEDGSFMYASLWDGHNFFLEREGGLLERTFGQNGNQVYRFFTEPRFHSVSEGILFLMNNLTNITVVPDELPTTYFSNRRSIYGYNANDVWPSQGTLNKETTTWDPQATEVESGVRSELETLLKQGLMIYNTEASGWSGDEMEKHINFDANQLIALATRLEPDDETGVYNVSYKEYREYAYNSWLKLPDLPENNQVTYRGGSIGGFLDPITSFNTAELMKAAISVVDSATEDEPRQIIEFKSLGIWGFVRVLFDDDIAERKLVDTSLGSPDGSLIELIWNWVQLPWVELIMDTQGHSYNLVFRTPPIDRKRIVEMINEPWFDLMKVDDSTVLNESLDFDTEVYSMYKLNYKAASWGTQDNLSAVIPVVPLPDYAEQFGARKWEQSSNLIPVSQTDDSESLINRSYVRDKGIEDLAWVIETSAYLPFTRTGTITILGDRRFKRGLWFNYEPTKEIFYIEGVTHNYENAESVDFTTTLQVRRGMVKDYVEGAYITTKDHGEVELSYFDIINIENLSNFLKEQLKVDLEDREEAASNPQSDSESNFRVIPEVFNFFRQRLQFAKPGEGQSFSTRPDDNGQDVANIA